MKTSRFLIAFTTLCANIALAQDIPNPGELVGIVTNPPKWHSFRRVIWDACGGEGERACLPSDPSFNLLPDRVAGVRCDRTLVPTIPTRPVPGASFVCSDLGDRSKPAVRARLDPKLKVRQDDQYGRISADLPINLLPILGTHNSYSNAADGSESGLSKNQEHSITDQLWLGARHVRLDPMGDGFRHLLCHMSPDTYNADFLNFLRKVDKDVPGTDLGLCYLSVGPLAPGDIQGKISYARPFYLALREIRKWLERNPGEVISINVHNFWDSSNLAYIPPAELEAVIEHELRDIAYTRPSTLPRIWPTIRQIRSAGKQVLITATYTANSSFVWPNTLGDKLASIVTTDPNFYTCQNSNRPGIVEAERHGLPADPHLDPKHIGEGRAVAAVFDSASSRGYGHIGITEMDTAVFCGYNRIGLDFFYSLNKAPYIFGLLGSLDFRDGHRDDCTTCDDRPKRMIWSWQHDSQPRPGVPATIRALMPIVNNQQSVNIGEAQFYRWTQESESSNFPYACAHLADPSVPFPDLSNPWAYRWTITRTRGTWKDGEKACQELGPNYHFWRPMSSPENRRLIDAMKDSMMPQVWLNHMPGRMAALAGKPDAIVPATANFSEPVIITSGSGGKITTRYVGDPALAQLFTVTPDRAGSNMFTIRKTGSPVNLRPGRYSANIRFTETRPDGSGQDNDEVRITIEVPAPPK
ncbi:hypothetical protein F183_A31320 [Bryobacterales bacterium F-183]|nr:hypothetical protein F183_A31320 [Bryobacterales bacterium F-183]